MDKQGKVDQGKRRFLKKTVYLAPAIVTLPAMPFTASYGSQDTTGNGLPTRNGLPVKPGQPVTNILDTLTSRRKPL
jgi:hypothetical protein